EELASATASMDDAARHVCRWLESHEGFRPEAVCVMQGNIPVRKPGQIDEAIERLSTLPQATAVCTAEAVRERPEWFKRFVDERTQQAAPYLPGAFGYRTQDFAPLYRIDGAIMIPRLETLYAHESDRSVHAWLGPRTHLLIQEDARYSLEVDYPDEVALAEFYLLCERYGPKWYEEWVRQCMRDEKLEVGSRK
ncbi:MAG: hypothetical protein HYU33_01970, partial [Candidatus Omnitrophica bacterium]|nr:hypothetical protein [Candidatus Omnitrophota bacterium]